MARSPRHSAAYIANREMQLELMDLLTHDERMLICEYGFKDGALAIRQFYGRLDEARKHLERQRQALQVQRWESIKLRWNS